MLSSSNNKKKYTSQTSRSKTSSNFYRNAKKITENQMAIEETKKLYQKYYENPNPILISQLKTEILNLFLCNFKYNDITVINKILSKYFYFKYITLGPCDPQKKKPKVPKSGPLTEGEKVKLAKEKRDQEIEQMNIISKMTIGLGRHLASTNNLHLIY